MKRPFMPAVLVGGGIVMMVAATVIADTLDEALVRTYLTNPQLEARRAQTRGKSETVNQALANWRPRIDLTGEEACRLFENESKGTSLTSHCYATRAARFTLMQSLYRGGRTVAQVEQTEAQISSDWQQLAFVEQNVLLAAATTYLNLWRDRTILDLNISNEKILRYQLQATQDRFAVGEITRTDVSQAEARLARAAATRRQSLGAVEISRAVYARVVGNTPGALTLPAAPVSNLPITREEAIALAQRGVPLLKAAIHAADAAAAGIRLAEGEKWPMLSMKTSLSWTWREDAVSFHTETVEVILALGFPLYQQGLTDSKVREAKHNAGWRVHEVEGARRQAVASAVQAWESLETTRAQIRANRIRIAAAEMAMEGVQQEAQVGSRTVLDVLNAEQEQFEARVALTRVERDERVAAFQLLAAVGRMTVQEMRLPTLPYDPKAYYHDVRGMWFDTGSPAEDDTVEDRPLSASERGK